MKTNLALLAYQTGVSTVGKAPSLFHLSSGQENRSPFQVLPHLKASQDIHLLFTLATAEKLTMILPLLHGSRDE